MQAGTDEPVAATRAVAAATAALAVGAVPLFLVGALAGSLEEALGFGPGGTGAALAVFFVVGGLSAVPAGWVTERIGAPAAMRAGVAISGSSGLAIAVVVGSWLELAIALGVAGIAIAFVDTGASGWFAAAVPDDRHGAAFGVKEASVPAASLLAGLSIPLLADRLGWESAFLLGALLAPVVWFVVPSSSAPVAPAPVGEGGRPRYGALVVFAAGIAFGTASATAAATFLVPAFEDAGWSAADAGILLSVASVAAIAGRLVLGWLSDRRAGLVWALLVATMTTGGAAAIGLALADGGALGTAAAVLVLGGGWAWTGLAFLAMLQVTRDAPAVGAGIVLAGLSLGGAAGPATFGALSVGSTATAWAAVAVSFLLGAALTALARRWEQRARPAPT